MPKGIYKRKIKDLLLVIGPSIVYVPLTRGLFTVIELADAFRVAKRSWYACGLYAYSNGTRDGRVRKIGLARFILKVRNPKVEVDHKNLCTLDNRKNGNLRKATKQQNSFNAPARSNNNTGVRGVYKRGDKYVATVGVDGKRVWLGTFNTLQQAAALRTKVAQKSHKEFYHE